MNYAKILLVPLLCGACPNPQEPTYYQDVAPILHQRCSTCHLEGGLAQDFLFDTYAQAHEMSTRIAMQAETEKMPPFMAAETEECQYDYDWKHDWRLPMDEIATLSHWSSIGAPEGDAKNPSPLEDPVIRHLTGQTQDLPKPTGYTTVLQTNVQDEFICYSVDPGFTSTVYLQGVEVLPDNLNVVHHVTTYIDFDGASQSKTNEMGFHPCTGGPGIANAAFVGGWIPGGGVIEMPQDSGVAIPPGARFVYQMHYHPISTPEFDQTQLRIQVSHTAPQKTATLTLLGNAKKTQADGTGLQPGPNDRAGAEFFVPANAKNHTETQKFIYKGRADQPATVFLTANHMHYVGTGMKVWIERTGNGPEGVQDSCLLQTPEWDFNWQQFFEYDVAAGKAPILYPGDSIWLRCTYDNTLDNPALREALRESDLADPVDVTLGEGTLDEMCLFALGVVLEN